MLKKLTFQRWLLALTLGVFLWSGFNVSAQQVNRNIAGSNLTAITTTYMAGTSNVVLNFQTSIVSPDGVTGEWVGDVELDFPAGVSVVSASIMQNVDNWLNWEGQTGNGVLTSWTAPAYGNYLVSGDVAPFTVTVNIDPAFAGNMNIGWSIIGEVYGAAPHTVTGTVTLAQQLAEPGIELLTSDLPLGNRPIGAWKKSGKFEIVNNPGRGDATITASEIDDVTGFLQLENPMLPYVLAEGASLEIGLTSTAAASNGDAFAGTYGLVFNNGDRSLATATYSALAYTPVAGNVWESAVAAGVSAPYGSGVFSASALYNVYELPGAAADGKNFVYKMTIPSDRLFSLDPLTTAGAKWALYAEGFEGVGGPDVDNALLSGTGVVSGHPLFAGTYYLVFSTTGADFNVYFDASVSMPLPVAATYAAPADGAININNGMSLSWTFGNYTDEYQLVLGTTYPPSTIVVPFTSNLATSYVLTGLQPNLQYFWQVNSRNTSGTTTGPVWGFTTSIDVPTGLTASVVDLTPTVPTVAVNLSWTGDNSRAFLGYNVYRNGVKLNATLVTGTTYADLGLARNTTYTYNVTSVYDEGESAFSVPAVVNTKGVGVVNGTVTDALTSTVIAGATVNIDGAAGSYTLTTAANGTYSAQVYAGTYGISVSAEGYNNVTSAGVVVAHAATVTTDFQLLEIAYPVDFVIASELSDDQVILEWGFDIESFVPQQYPFNTTGMSQAQIAKSWKEFLNESHINADGSTSSNRALVEYQIYREKAYQPETAELIGTTSQNQFVDFDWGLQDWGVYQWNVVVVYSTQLSAPVSSNTLDKDMNTMVDVTVTLNSNDSPAGTMVTFTNISEPALELEYTTLLGDAGTFAWDAFRRGTYNIEVSRPGYATITESNVDIFDASSFEWLLIEVLAVPTDLYVTPTGLATWTGGSAAGVDPFTPKFEAFDAGIPADWTQIRYNGSDGDWEFCDNCGAYTEPINTDGKFLVCDSDGNITLVYDAGLFTAAMNMTGETAMYLDYDRNFQEYAGVGEIAIRVYSGGTAAGNLEEVLDASVIDDPIGGVHKTYMFDPSGYADPSQVYIEFWYSTEGDVYAWGFGIDNVLVTNVAPVAPVRSFQAYKVFNDGVLVAEVTEPTYQYGTNGEVLVDGQTYLAEVAAVFSTGQSDKASYTWTYIACDNYAAPENFTATQVEGTVDVSLTWTVPTIPPADDQIDFARLYRDGEVIAELEGASYLDEDLDFATYTYCITFVYDSGAETCPATICETVEVTGGGMVNGNVKQAAYLGGANIEGAEVMLTNTADNTITFTFTTNAAGNYTGEVLAGTYDYAVSADGYVTATLEDVLVAQTATVTRNFELMEYPYPVGDITAVEITDNAVQVNWGAGGGGGGGSIAEWLYYDDGTNVDGIGGPAVFSWAVKFDPSQLTAYAGTSLTKISLYNRTSDVNLLQIYEGTNAETLLYEQNLTGLPIEDWAEVSLNTPVVLDVTKELWITVYTTAGAVYPAGCGPTTNQPNGDLITLDGVLWEHLSDYDLPYTWNLRGFVTDMVTNRTVEIANVQNTAGYKSYPENTTFEASGVVNTSANASIDVYAHEANRALTGYSVYRTTCATGDLQFLGFTLDEQFTDNTWGAAEAGVYKWGVIAEYDQNSSEVRFSNCLDKDMITQVSVAVTCNSLDSPAETDVMFTNTSEPDLALAYEVTLDETGVYAWDEFRKGTYDIYVEKFGFAPISLTGYVIDGPEAFAWVLEELLVPVADLYVTPTGYATWRQGGIIPFEPFMEDFNAGLPDTWTIVDAGSTNDTWYNTTGYNGNSVDGTPFMFANSDAAGSGSTMNEQMISPVINGENAEELYLMFDYVYQYIGNEHFSVDVFDGTDWVEVFYTEADSGPWPWGPTASEVIDVTEHANADFQVRFNYVSNGWNWYVAVDNVVVTDNMDRYANRSLQNYKVWLDGIFVTDTENTFYQYDTETLVPGQEYFSEVAAVYTNGMSAKMNYTWTYYPCDSFPGPQQFDAEVIDETDVLLTWSDILPLELVQITQNPGAPANGYFQSYGYGYGVAYDMSAYPDALVNSIDFHHASWGTTGTWNYNIHVYNWDTKTLIGTYGPFQTTGNDIWEMGVELPNVSTGGASTVAILMEPLSNSSTDAYPDLSSDNDANPQGSIFGSLSDVNAIGSSAIGNFLMEAYIYTAYGAVRATPVTFDYVKAPAAQARIASTTVAELPVITQSVNRNSRVDDTFVGANIYRDGMMIAEMLTDTSYLDAAVEPGVYNYCITYVYESGAESCPDANCIEVSLTEDCVAPIDLTAVLAADPAKVILTWNSFAGAWMHYGDLVYVDAIGLTDFSAFTVAIQWDPEDLADYDGRAFSKMRLYYGTGSIGDVMVQVWEGTTLVMEQAVTTAIVGESWNEIEFTEPVVIDATKSYRVGYTTSNYDGYPAGAQNYANDLNSDLVLLDGAWDNLSNYLPYSWMIETFIGEAPAGAFNAPVESTIISKATSANLVSSPVAVNTTRSDVGRNADRAFLGYNVYREGAQVNSELVLENTYLDIPGTPGNYCYTVTAVYSLCGESVPSNEACIDVLVGVNDQDLANNRIYPNPSNSIVNIELTSNISQVVVYNYVGQVVFEQNVTKSETIQLNVRNYESGAYLVKFLTNAGESFTKKVVVTK